MTDRCSYSSIWKVAYPLILMNAGMTIMQFCDRKFLAMHSEEEVAASLPAGVLSFTILSFFIVLVAYTSTVVAQYFGRGKLHSCIQATWNGFYLSVFFGVVVVCLMPLIGLPVLNHSGHEAHLIPLERDYFTTLIPGAAFACMNTAFVTFFNGSGRTIYSACINILACGVNVILDYMLIFGRWGAPEMGIGGAGLATSLSCAFGASLAATCFLGQKQSRYPTRSHRSLSLKEIKRLFRFGSPSALQVLSDVGAYAGFAFLIGLIDQEAMVVTTIVIAINHMAFYPMLGLADATGILTGQLMGAHHPNLVFRLTYRAWMLATLYMAIIALFYVFFPEWLFGQFAPQGNSQTEAFAEIIRKGKYLLLCALIYNVFDALKFVFMGALRGAGDTRACVIITTVCAWGIMIPGMAIMIFFFNQGVVSVWIFSSVCVLLEAGIYFWRFRTEKWKNIHVIDPIQTAMDNPLPPEEIP